MNKIILTLKSRTFWTLVVLFVINGVAAIKGYIPAGLAAPIDLALGLLATYFHVNPSQDYTG